MIRPLLIPLLLAPLVSLTPRSAGSQETAVRFEVSGVADSTFSFQVGRHPWVARGQRGILVDPRQRDVLVGRFRVLAVQGGLATALITGQTTAITNQFVALLTRPRTPWYRDPHFWVGAAAGGALGLMLGQL